MISDNGPQFVSSEFKKFSKEWDYEQRTSSPGNSKGNGKVESAVKTAKNLIRKALDAGTDPYLAILDYRNTPTQGMESSPVQRLMNRRTRTLLPTTKALLEPRTTLPDQDTKDLSKRQQQQSKYYNPHTRALTPLDKGDVVRMKPFQLGSKVWKKATVASRLDERSYAVETANGEIYRRNRVHLKKSKENADTPESEVTPRSPEPSPSNTTTSTNGTAPIPEIPAPAAPPARPQITRRSPVYLKDYIITYQISLVLSFSKDIPKNYCL